MKNMMAACRQSGFTLIEVLVAAALGLTVTAAATQLYLQASKTASLTTQRILMQQDARAASDLMMRDISLAGASFQNSVGLASGTSLSPRYGCDTATCYLGGGSGINFPSGSGTIYSLYPVLPGYNAGILVNGQTTDTITVTSADTDFLLNCYTAKVINSTTVTFTTTALCTSGGVAAVTDLTAGLQTGDIVFFNGTNTKLGSSVQLIGLVTSTSGTVSPFTVNFAIGDNLRLNQPAATTGDFATCFANSGTGCTGTGTRLWVISYYIALGYGGTPVLMRQVNGQTPDPVAPNVFNLKFTYDIYDADTKLLTSELPSPTETDYMDIKKVNLAHMSVRSTDKGLNGYQGTDIRTSVSVRNLAATGITN